MRTLLCLAFTIGVAACSTETTDRVVGELASERIELTAEFAERITRVEVEEGETVTAGQVILRQDDARMAAKLAELNAAVEQHRARLAELKRGPRSEQIDQARANLDGAERELDFRNAELERIREVKARGLTSAEDLDKATAAYDAAVASVRLRRAQLEEQLAGTTIEELIQAEQLLIQAEARRDATAIDVQRHVIVAPVDGIADTRLFEPGERPLAGQPVFVMLEGAQAHARVFIPESMRVSITPGMAASIHVDGLDAALEGRVRWVASDPVFTPYYALTERDRKRLSYMAKIDIVEERERLPDGVPVEVTFE